MTASPADPVARLSAALLVPLFLLVTAGAATAQQVPSEGPVQLLPPTPTQPAAPAASPQSGVAVPEAEQGIDVQTLQRQGIQVDSLGGVTPDAIGVLTAEQGGFDVGLWRGTPYAVAARWLPRIPADLTSPTLRRLALRLLMTSAPPPQPAQVASLGETGLETDPVDGQLLQLRVERLMAMGEVERLGDLLRAVPNSAMTEALRRARTEVALILDRPEAACADVRQGIALNPAASFWAKGLIYCQILQGRIDQAQLGLDLLREQGGGKDDLFTTLATHFAGADAQDLPPGPIAPIDFAILRGLNYPLPEDLPERIGAMLYKAVALAPNASLELRAWAGEEALQRGLLDGGAVAAIYDGFSFSEEELANALSLAPELPDARGRALLHHAMRRQVLPIARAEVLRSYLDLAARSGRYTMALQVALPFLSGVPIRSDLAWFAETASKAFYLLGRFEQGGAWLQVLQRAAESSEELRAGLLRLWPYVRLSGSLGWPDQPTIADWASGIEAPVGLALADAGEDDFGDTDFGAVEAASAAEPDAAATALKRAAVLLAAFTTLDIEDPLAWHDLAEDAEAASLSGDDLALVLALGEAGEAERLGEFLIFALVLMGNDEARPAPVLHLATVLDGLVRAGLGQEARALALESLIQHGL